MQRMPDCHEAVQGSMGGKKGFARARPDGGRRRWLTRGVPGTVARLGTWLLQLLGGRCWSLLLRLQLQRLLRPWRQLLQA